MISGAVAGLGTITPASGFVAPWHGAIIGVVAGLVCFWACTWLKHRFKYDDSLDVFGVHGIGGMVGTLLAGIFAVSAIGGTAGLIEGHPQQLLIQAYGVAVTLVWSGGVTFVLLKLVSVFVPLRVSLQQELEGLDISQHGEALSSSLSNYRIRATPLSRIMSRLCRAARLSRHAYDLSATE
jgi:Amt family ammonium transporter